MRSSERTFSQLLGYRDETAERRDSAGGIEVRSGHGWDGQPQQQLGLGSGPGRKYQVHNSQIKAPSDMMALGDATLMAISTTNGPKGIGYGELSYEEGYGWSGFVGRGGTPHVTVVDRANRARHPRARFNIAFCDGHLESIRNDELFIRKVNPHRARWNNDNEPHYETYPEFEEPRQ